MNNRRALVVLSGGQDSVTCLFWARERFTVSAIGFDYGQRHKNELDCAEAICRQHDIAFERIHTPIISALSKNALTETTMRVDEKKPDDSPPNTLVEGRNLLFFSYAAIYAKTQGIADIIVGVSETDFSGYPDCRDIFIKSLNVTLNLGMDYPFTLHTPLMWRTKAQVWKLADDLNVIDIIKNETLTCYNGIKANGCGNCPACDLRKKGYEEYRACMK